MDIAFLFVYSYIMLSGHPPFYGKCGTDCGWEKGENCKSCQVSMQYTPHKIMCGMHMRAQDLNSISVEHFINEHTKCYEHRAFRGVSSVTALAS